MTLILSWNESLHQTRYETNNVNQLAKVANATGEIPPEVHETLHAVRRVAERIDSAIGGLAGDAQ